MRRNQGRPGAAEGPDRLRAALSNLSAVPGVTLHDLGGVAVVGTDLEGGLERYARLVAASVGRGELAIGMGGGHEIAWGTIGGLMQSGVVKEGDTVGVLNFDAHFDLRPGEEPTSGNSFAVALRANPCLRYFALGISEPSNTSTLFQTARDLDARWRLDDELTLNHLGERRGELTDWVAGLDHLYTTVCLDVLPGWVAPGVSAPAARGVGIEVVESLIGLAAGSGKLRAMDVAELNPRYDIDDRTARAAARLVWRVVREWAS